MLNEAILTNMGAGWCNFKLSDFEGRPSYVRDLPIDVINGYIDYIKTGHCVIEFDEETSWFSLVVCNESEVYIIAHRNGLEFYSIDLNANDVLDELFVEIEDNLDDWINWCFCLGDEKDMYRIELQNKIDKIKKERE